MKRNHRLTLDTLFGLIAAATTVTSFAAVTVAKEGKYENVGCYTSTMQTNAPVKGQMGGSYDGLGSSGYNALSGQATVRIPLN